MLLHTLLRAAIFGRFTFAPRIHSLGSGFIGGLPLLLLDFHLATLVCFFRHAATPDLFALSGRLSAPALTPASRFLPPIYLYAIDKRQEPADFAVVVIFFDFMLR